MIKFFDCNCQIGRFRDPLPEHFTDAVGLMEELEYNEISEALVFHAFAKDNSPSLGNGRLLGEIAGHRLHPCWVALPHHTGEMPPPKEFVDSMLARGVRALRLFPLSHQYRFTEWCCGELMAELEKRRVPLFLESDTNATIDDVAAMLASHPKLRLTLLRPNYRMDRCLYPLFERFPQFSIEISMYQTNSGIQAVCKRFGADRLLFGTNLPFSNAGVPISMVMYAQISEEEKALIAGENLRRLLREVAE